MGQLIDRTARAIIGAVMNRDYQEYLDALGFVPQVIGGLVANAEVSRNETLTKSRESEIPPIAIQSTLSPEWDELQKRALACTQCKLHSERHSVVFGEGNRQARLMFVGEGPGEQEDLQGLPFVGAAGQLLTKMIEAMGIKRSDVYIANVVKCRPPQNRNPEPDEIQACHPYLRTQIRLIDPVVIVALGKFAAQLLLESNAPISKLRGTFHEHSSLKRQDQSFIQVMPTFHPAYLLRDSSMKKHAWDDLKQVMGVLGFKA